MRPTALLLALAALCLLPASSSAASATSAQSGAERAVKEEIGNRWLLLETVPRTVASRGASAAVDCGEVSRGRFLCSWSASNELRGQDAQGFAVVRPRWQDDPEARLFAEVCTTRDAQSCV